MSITIKARYDGKALYPEVPLDFEPDTEVELTIEPVEEPKAGAEGSFLRTLRSIKIDGPRDWSTRLEDYLYGDLEDED